MFINGGFKWLLTGFYTKNVFFALIFPMIIYSMYYALRDDKCIIIDKEVKTMDMNKYAMLNALKQEGSVESFSFDGRSFLVRK